MPGDGDPHAPSATATRPSSWRSARPGRSTSTKPELGHLKKADAPPMRHLAEFRDEAGELQLGETRDRRVLRGGRAREDRRASPRARAFRGRSSATTSRAARSPTARTTCARRARSAPRPRPRACCKGIRGPGQMGNKRVTQKGLEIVAWTRRRTCCWCAARSRARAAASWRCAAMPDAPHSSQAHAGLAAKKVKLDDSRLRRALQRAARAPERARRAGRPPARHGGHQDPRHGLRRRRQALAPEGHRPRSRGLQPLADLDRRWHRVRAPAALLHLQGQPQGAARRAAQRALAARRARLDRDPRRGGVHGARRPARRSTCSTIGTPPDAGPTLVVLDRRGVATPRCRSATSRAWRC